MTAHTLLMCVPMLALLVWAAAEDIRSRRIPNWLTIALGLSGIMQSWMLGHTVTPLQSILGWLSGLGLLFVLFAIGAVGAGDVKLLAGVGAWIGPLLVAEVFALEALIGMAIVLVQSMQQHRVRTLLRNSAVIAINLIHVSQLGADHVQETGQSAQSVERPLPYAVPVLLATVAVVLLAYLTGR
jgi:prepilin peptidase CpaA